MTTPVLVVDSNDRERRRTASVLRFAAYQVEVARTMTQARSHLRRHNFGAIVIDPWSEATDPFDALATLRPQTEAPIIVVAASAEEVDKVSALDAGADDYITKPYGVEELLARLRVAFRRSTNGSTVAPPLVTADFTVDVADRRWLRSDGSTVHLTPTEWRIVEVLARRAGHLVPQAELLASVWGPDAVDKPGNLRVYLTAIRQKVEPEPGRPRYFVTAPGLGIRFETEPSGLAASQ